MAEHAYPVKEMVSRNLLDTLRGVSTAGGYRVDLTAERATRPPNRPRPFLAVLYEGDDDPVAEDDQNLGYSEWLRPYAVLIYAFGSEAAAEFRPYDEPLNLAAADVEKAVMADVTRGGYARNTFCDGTQKLDDPNELPAVAVMFRVHYRTAEDNPYAR